MALAYVLQGLCVQLGNVVLYDVSESQGMESIEVMPPTEAIA